MIDVSVDELNAITLPDFPNMNQVAGKEHYKLLAWLSSTGSFKTIYDVGSYKGYSALALAHNPKVNVISWDVADQIDPEVKRKNITFKKGDVLKDKKLLKADLILLDTYHDGSFERKFYEHIKGKFKGILILDDIKLNGAMVDFWESITEPKNDITHLGHYTGTGIVYF